MLTGGLQPSIRWIQTLCSIPRTVAMVRGSLHGEPDADYLGGQAVGQRRSLGGRLRSDEFAQNLANIVRGFRDGGHASSLIDLTWPRIVRAERERHVAGIAC